MGLFFHLIGLLLLPFVLSQQYEGDVIPNQMPAVPGAELAFWKISGGVFGTDATLINYMSFPGGKRQDTTKIKRVVVTLSGVPTNVDGYFTYTRNALRRASGFDPEVNEESVTIVAPFFATENDRTRGYPFSNGNSTSSALVWQGTSWAAGAGSQYPVSSNGAISSFDALDQILRYFDNPFLYPNLKQIVVAGHSRGAQMNHRYTAVGKELLLRTPVVYWVGNPSSFLWLDSQERPVPGRIAACPQFDDWMYGLSNYNIQYERSFVQLGKNAGLVRARYNRRHIAYSRGLNDFGDASGNDCAPSTTGANRGARFLNFMRAFPPDSGDTVDYTPGVGHNGAEMMQRDAGVHRLFLDNFNGNGSRHADFGPRQVEGDNPHPNNT